MHEPSKGVLPREAILARLRAEPPLIEGMLSPAEQVQPAGVDITLRRVSHFVEAGLLGRAGEDRRLADVEEVAFDGEGYVHLPPGAYQIQYNEIVNVPTDLVAIGRPRSSLLRSGVTIHTALWDAGYRGRSVSLLVVHNPHGFRLQRDARVLQLVFLALAQPTQEGYAGAYTNENL